MTEHNHAKAQTETRSKAGIAFEEWFAEYRRKWLPWGGVDETLIKKAAWYAWVAAIEFAAPTKRWPWQ